MTIRRKKSVERCAQLFIIALIIVLSGCVQKYPISYYASPGDTIVLGLGGVQRNSQGANNLTADDVTITLTNTSTQAVTTLTPGHFFKTYPDYSSGLNFQSIHGVLQGSLVPFDGGWFMTAKLPNTGLPPGSYKISITSPTNAVVNTNWCYSVNVCEGDLTNIPLQIVNDNDSTLSDNYAQQFTYYPAQINRLNVSPSQTPDSAGYSAVGGLQLVVNFPAANYVTNLPIVALPYSHNPSLSLQQNIINNGDGTKSLVVLLMSSQNFVTAANRKPLTPLMSDLSLSFFFYPASGINSNPTQQLGDFQIDQSRSHYYDTAGNIINSLQPVMTYQ